MSRLPIPACFDEDMVTLQRCDHSGDAISIVAQRENYCDSNHNSRYQRDEMEFARLTISLRQQVCDADIDQNVG